MSFVYYRLADSHQATQREMRYPANVRRSLWYLGSVTLRRDSQRKSFMPIRIPLRVYLHAVSHDVESSSVNGGFWYRDPILTWLGYHLAWQSKIKIHAISDIFPGSLVRSTPTCACCWLWRSYFRSLRCERIFNIGFWYRDFILTWLLWYVTRCECDFVPMWHDSQRQSFMQTWISLFSFLQAHWRGRRQHVLVARHDVYVFVRYAVRAYLQYWFLISWSYTNVTWFLW